MEKKDVICVDGGTGKNILEIFKEKNKYFDAPCNGSGNCGKCRVRLLEGAAEPTEREKRLLTKEELAAGVRLACQVIPEQECSLLILGEQHLETDTESQLLNAVSSNVQSQTAAGRKSGQEYGIAIDIGTTTIAAVLTELSTGKNIAVETMVNHQRVYGADVLSRIKAAAEGKGEQLRQIVREDLKQIINALLKSAPVEKKYIKRIVIAANTTMCHLLLGYTCDTLGKAPFCPVDISLQRRTAKELLKTAELEAEVTILPGISAFVGADIVAGIMACKMQEKEEYSLFLDIGTNGEMVVGNREGLFVTSAAAGPAFEGGNISCGAASVPGAIDKVEIRFPYTRVHTLGEKAAIGLCGTGVIEVVYELLKNRILDRNGTLTERFLEEGYPLIENKIYFSQKDVREFQMAKSAIRAGMEQLLEGSGIKKEDIKNVYLAGSFGCHIPVEKAVGTGLLPKELTEKMKPAGNASLEGAKQYLLYQETAKIEKIISLAKDRKLASDKGFQEKFLQYMSF